MADQRCGTCLYFKPSHTNADIPGTCFYWRFVDVPVWVSAAFGEMYEDEGADCPCYQPKDDKEQP